MRGPWGGGSRGWRSALGLAASCHSDQRTAGQSLNSAGPQFPHWESRDNCPAPVNQCDEQNNEASSSSLEPANMLPDLEKGTLLM